MHVVNDDGIIRKDGIIQPINTGLRFDMENDRNTSHDVTSGTSSWTGL